MSRLVSCEGWRLKKTMLIHASRLTLLLSCLCCACLVHQLSLSTILLSHLASHLLDCTSFATVTLGRLVTRYSSLANPSLVTHTSHLASLDARSSKQPTRTPSPSLPNESSFGVLLSLRSRQSRKRLQKLEKRSGVVKSWKTRQSWRRCRRRSPVCRIRAQSIGADHKSGWVGGSF